MNALTVIPSAPVPAFTISDVERVALAIAKGGLFGSKDPNAVLTLCLLAQAEGQHPATVFRDYHVISGKPAKKADAMLRDFINSGGKVKWHTLDDTCADATFTHPSGEARIDWTLERAKKAGLATPMWTKYPRQMLRSRVISEGIRTVYPGATSGLYVTEEVQDMAGDVSEAAVEHPREPEPASKGRERMEGPFPTVAALREECRAIRSDFEAAQDSDELEEAIDRHGQTIAQIRRYKPDWWENDDYGLMHVMSARRMALAPGGADVGEVPAAEPRLEDGLTSEGAQRLHAMLMQCPTVEACKQWRKDHDQALKAVAADSEMQGRILFDCYQQRMGKLTADLTTVG